MNPTPLPAGVEPTIWEKLFQWISPMVTPKLKASIWDMVQNIEDFFSAYGHWIFLGLTFLGCVVLVVLYFRQKQQTIEKLWKLILFFLSKRQMMIPIVYTFAQRDALLSEKDLQKLLEIRELSRSVPLRKDPTRRMEIEREVSHILLDFFTKIEKNKNYPSKTTMDRILEDFEFIDEKLVELQKVYNREALLWNKARNFFLVRPLAWVFRFPAFKFFGQKIS